MLVLFRGLSSMFAALGYDEMFFILTALMGRLKEKENEPSEAYHG